MMAIKRLLDEAVVEPEPKKMKYSFSETFEDVPSKSNHLPLVPIQKTLHEACENRDLISVKELLKLGTNVDDLNDEGLTPLIIACINGHFDIVVVLLAHGANPNLLDCTGKSPFHMAVAYGKLSMVQKMLEYKADVNLQDSEGKAPIHYAAFLGHLKIVKLLLKYEADVNLEDNDGSIPLSMAIASKKDKIAEVLLNHGANANGVMVFDEDVSWQWTFLIQACHNNNYKLVKTLIKHGADVNVTSHDFTPLYFAIKNGPSCVSLLLEAGSDLNIMTASGSPLHHAVRYGNVEAVSQLIEFGAKVNAQDFDGFTPFHVAVLSYSDVKKNECLKIVGRLLEENVDLNCRNINGNTALELAFAKNCHDIIRMITCKFFPKPLEYFL